ncbi:MAG TPA: 7-carboxy-7-deazaguanine synthase QueE [Stenomitos sp.]
MMTATVATAESLLLPTASLIEIFSAIQGEGLNVGTRQLFIRFGGCDLRCRYCDSPHTWHPQSDCRIEVTPGQRDFEVQPNPVSVSQLVEWVHQLWRSPLHDSISLTGGEPLLHQAFLAAFLPALNHRMPIYLETGGHHPAALTTLATYVDLVGMDLKLPSVSGEMHWEAHAACLQICQDTNTEAFCKIIVSNATDPAELDQAAQLVAHINPHIPVFLQPVTPISAKGEPTPPMPDQVLEWQARMKAVLASVRVVPQTHKMMGQL